MRYPGGYDDYESARLARAAAAAAPAPAPVAAAASPKGSGRATPAPATASKSTQPRRGGAKRQREIERVERDIETRETEIRDLEQRLADPEVYHDGAKAKDLVTRYERLRAEVDSLWQKLGEL